MYRRARRRCLANRNSLLNQTLELRGRRHFPDTRPDALPADVDCARATVAFLAARLHLHAELLSCRHHARPRRHLHAFVAVHQRRFIHHHGSSSRRPLLLSDADEEAAARNEAMDGSDDDEEHCDEEVARHMGERGRWEPLRRTCVAEDALVNVKNGSEQEARRMGLLPLSQFLYGNSQNFLNKRNRTKLGKGWVGGPIRRVV